MKNKQTAVEWLEVKFKLYRNEKLTDWDLIFEDAKKMEKKQIAKAYSEGIGDMSIGHFYNNGHDYFNNTYGK